MDEPEPLEMVLARQAAGGDAGAARALCDHLASRFGLEPLTPATAYVVTSGDYSDYGIRGVFTTREAAEEFIGGDPFVVNGVVAEWTVRPWNEVLGTDS